MAKTAVEPEKCFLINTARAVNLVQKDELHDYLNNLRCLVFNADHGKSMALQNVRKDASNGIGGHSDRWANWDAIIEFID